MKFAKNAVVIDLININMGYMKKYEINPPNRQQME